MGVDAEFSKFCSGKEGETVTVRFGYVVIRAITSALKSSQTGSLPAANRRQQNTWLFLFNKLS